MSAEQKGVSIHIKARAATAQRLTVGQVHSLADVEVSVSNWVESDAAGETHRGLFFDARSTGPSVGDAVRVAMKVSDAILNSLSFASAAGAGPLEPLAIYHDVGDGCHVRQFIELPLGPTVSRLVRSDRLSAIVQATDLLEGERRDRILTAMSWYRKAVMERQPVDAFTAAWLGLETLNPLLAKHYSVASEQVYRKCPKCDADVVTAPISAGIRALLQAVGGKELWRTASIRRTSLLHGTRPMNEVHEDLPHLARTMASALRTATLLLLGADERQVANFESSAMPVPRSHRLRADYVLRGFSVAQVRRGPDYPALRLHSFANAKREHIGTRTVETAETRWEVVHFEGQYRFVNLVVDAERDPDNRNPSVEVKLFGQLPKEGSLIVESSDGRGAQAADEEEL